MLSWHRTQLSDLSWTSRLTSSCFFKFQAPHGFPDKPDAYFLKLNEKNDFDYFGAFIWRPKPPTNASSSYISVRFQSLLESNVFDVIIVDVVDEHIDLNFVVFVDLILEIKAQFFWQKCDLILPRFFC